MHPNKVTKYLTDQSCFIISLIFIADMYDYCALKPWYDLKILELQLPTLRHAKDSTPVRFTFGIILIPQVLRLRAKIRFINGILKHFLHHSQLIWLLCSKHIPLNPYWPEYQSVVKYRWELTLEYFPYYTFFLFLNRNITKYVYKNTFFFEDYHHAKDILSLPVPGLCILQTPVRS